MRKTTQISITSHVVIFFLVPSIILNLFFLLRDNHEILRYGRSTLSWTRKAAEEAEYVAAISCSGHGKTYLDGSPSPFDGKAPRCECNTCFGGVGCSKVLPACAADADSGNPYFLEPYWMQNAASSAVVVSGWHRMGYAAFSEGPIVTKELEKAIRQLHDTVGNAATKGRYIVFGVSSIQLLNAAVLIIRGSVELTYSGQGLRCGVSARVLRWSSI